MTRADQDHLKHKAREIARSSGRRYPDVLAELRRAPRRAPSAELVRLCPGLAHPIDGGRCARPAGHRDYDSGWGGCSLDAHYPSFIWQGYIEARDAASHAKHEAWLAALSPQERAEHDAEEEAAYWAQVADDARETYDPEAERDLEYALDAADEERWEAEAAAREEAGGYDEDPYDEWEEDYR
ncbi:hypothetical protein [Streptomyces tsukubensis]|uniref:hypothetical protein n=1 Tax=Streptomyces tsukubensis TaxID=83656 RepID=UPI00344BDA5F